MAQSISIADYLLTRLEQLGVKSIFGVPGDYNLGFLDFVEDHHTIKWVGNCNELNAAYAADGYARVKESSVGVVLTTFGVGELSAINGIAGAFSEVVPVVHLVGVPSTFQQKTKPTLHHTLGDGRYNAYLDAARVVTCSQASLIDKNLAASEIDRVLIDCITLARPVYLMLPTDLIYEKISNERLKSPLSKHLPPNDPHVEDFVIDLIYDKVRSANGDVVVLVDACAVRHDVREELRDLLKVTKFPVYAAPMGKTAVDEDYERYGGIYIGSLTKPEIKHHVESASLILSVGAIKSDVNTGQFSYHIDTKRTIELHSSHTRIQYALFENIGMKQLMPKLTERLKNLWSSATEVPVVPFTCQVPQTKNDIITQEWLWPRLQSFFRPHDVIVTETGTANFGILDIPLPSGSLLLNQILWGSIGWSVGSTLGAALAARERKLGRTILFIGDGSMQLTVQELSTIMRENLTPIIFLLNNYGYTIERCIHGKERKYNDVVNWKWTSLLQVLGDINGHHSRSITVKTTHELSSLLENTEFIKADQVQLVEVIMEKYDAPRALEEQTKQAAVHV